MGAFVWLYSPRTNSPHITMNSFAVFATLLAAACAAPQTVVNTVNQGPQTGPATPIIGDAVATPKGFRSLALEGFSEDLNQDGFVDPIVPAAPAPVVVPAPVPAPIARIAAPVAVAPQVAFPAPVAALRQPSPFPCLCIPPSCRTCLQHCRSCRPCLQCPCDHCSTRCPCCPRCHQNHLPHPCAIQTCPCRSCL